MRCLSKFLSILLVFTCTCSLYAQTNSKTTADVVEVRLTEILDRVIQYHPLVRAANLETEKGKAGVLSARGAFDPSLQFQQNQKTFDNTSYYQFQNFSLESATRTGVKIQMGTDYNTGQYLNPMDGISGTGTQYAGVSIPVLRDLIIDKKRADFQKSKVLNTMSYWERQLLVNEILEETVRQYILWQVYTESSNRIQLMISNAENRQSGLRKLFNAGASTAVDTLETYVQLEQYRAKLTEIQWKQLKSKLMLNAWLWSENNTPIELSPNTIPSTWGLEQLDSFSKQCYRNYNDSIDGWKNEVLPPQLKLLEYSISLNKIDLQYKSNKLLPQLDFKYQHLQHLNNFNFQDFGNLNNNNRFGVYFSSPLLYREARGEYQMAKYKYQQTAWKFESKQREFSIKIKTNYQEIEVSRKLYAKWVEIGKELTELYSMEMKRFDAGDANFFIVNTREMRALDAQLKSLDYRIDYLESCNRFLNFTGWYTQVIK